MADQTEAPADTADASEAPVVVEAAVDLAAETAKWKELSRKHEKAAKQLESRLKEFEDKDKTETERLSERATLAEKQAAENAQALARYRVAVDKSLPTELVDRLRGDTEDELSEDADRLLALLKPSGPHRFGDVDLGVRQTPPAPGGDERATARSLFQSGT